MATVLFIGAGRHQRRAILRARELGFRVVAVDRNPAAPGLAAADAGEPVDFADLDAVTEIGRRHGVGGVLTVAAERAVPVVATVAERLGLPSIGSETALRMTDKAAMRKALADAGLPQPSFATARTLEEAFAALERVEAPAVLKPLDASGQRGLHRIDSSADLEAHFADAAASSGAGGVIIESFREGAELNCMVVVRNRQPAVLTVSDRLRPAGPGFGVALAHVLPSSLPDEQLRRAERLAADVPTALGLRDGIAYPQLLAAPDGVGVEVVEVAARIPGGQMDEVVRRGIGVDLVEVALRQAVGEAVPDSLVRARFQQALAIRFLTAQPGSLPSGRVRRVRGLDDLLDAEGIAAAEHWIDVGEIIRPVQLDGDRRGYVIALGDSAEEALRRADAAVGLLRVEVEVVEAA